MCCFAKICFHRNKLKYMIPDKCLLCASPVFRHIPGDIMSLAQIDHPWDITKDTPDSTGIHPYIILISEIDSIREIW